MQRLSSYYANTPLIRISDRIYAKYEIYNPTGSIKDRVIINIIDNAEKMKMISNGDTLIEVSSGNAGISLAMLGAERGYKVIIIIPKNAPDNKKKQIVYYGAKVIEIPNNDFKLGRIIRDSLVKENGWFTPNQHFNKLNVFSHENTGREIVSDIRKEKKTIGAVIIASGTGGTVMGISNIVKKSFPKAEIIVVRPNINLDVFTDEDNELYTIGDSDFFLLDKTIVDKYIDVTYTEAKSTCNDLAKNHGMICGIISGANVYASRIWIKNNNSNRVAITVIGDRGYSLLD